jgi:pimeloyl-ACP methyl ester carboxylesterase
MELNHHRAGSGDPLVLIHGIGSRWQMWEPVIDWLAARHEVIAIDLPGFGASPMPPPGTAPGADSLASLLSAFLAQLGVERPHVAGNSLGGLIALELGRRGQTSSVAAVSPAGFANRAENAVALRSLCG